MLAYGFPALATQVIYVNKNNPNGSGNGSSWSTAYQTLQAAIAAANPSPANPVEIWIAKGTYIPSGTRATATFALKSHLSLLGGFAGTETSSATRLFNNFTVLSGDIGQTQSTGITEGNVAGAMNAGGSTNYLSDANFKDNAYNVLTAVNCTNVLLENLIITGGNANADGNSTAVATATQMLTVSTTNPTNSAAPFFDSTVTGGGLFVSSVYENYIPYYGLLLANCRFINNAAVIGGGVGAMRGRLGFIGCTFKGNYAVLGGGGIYEQDPSAIVDGSGFDGNFTSGDGGAIKYVTYSPNDEGVADRIFANNYAYGVLQRSVETDFRGSLDNTMASILGSRDAFNEMTHSNIAEAAISSTLTGVASAYISALNVKKPLDTDSVSASDFTSPESGIENGVFYIGNSIGTLILANTSLGDDDVSYTIEKRKRLFELFHWAPETGLMRTEFTGNKAAVGGAISIQHANVYFDVCTFEQNNATLAAGAVYGSLYDRLKMVSCGFYQNQSGKGFSAVLAALHTRMHLINCTFSQNKSSSSNAGHAVGMTSGSESDIANCIFWTNTSPRSVTGRADVFAATQSSIGGGIYSDLGPNYGEAVAYADLRYSCVESLDDLPPGKRYTVPAYSPFESKVAKSKFGNHSASFTFTKVTIDDRFFVQEGGATELGEGFHESIRNGHGNISSNPLLLEKYKVSFDSPVLEAGTNRSAVDEMIVSSLTGVDLNGGPRVKGTNVDMGAIEGGTFPNRIYVNYAATGANTGTSWQNAFTNLSTALSVNRSDVEYWVAKGTYYPTTSPAGGGEPRDRYFQLPERSVILGGFVGTETSVAQRNSEANPTILSGDLGVLGNDSDNAYEVIVVDNNTRSVLDGFTITKGRGWSGAGMFIQNARSDVRNCKFIDNIAEGFGGAVCSFGTSDASFYNCVFSNNVAQRYSGGAMQVGSSVRIDNCMFVGNTALSGGAIQFEPTSTSCFCYVNNSLFAGNIITNGYNQSYGAGIFSQGETMINNCTFTGNKIIANTSASPAGAGLHFGGWGNGHLTVASSILWNNVVVNSGSGKTEVELQEMKIASVTAGQIYIHDNIIQDFSKSEEAYYYSNLDVDPQFANPANGDYRLTQFSPAIDISPANSFISKFDLAQSNRFYNAIGETNAYGVDPILDLGAYEFQTPAVRVPTVVRITRFCGDPTSTYRFDLDLAGKSLAGTTLQWEINVGQGYVPVSGANYSGGTTASLTVSGVTVAMNGHRFRVRGTGALAFSSSSVVLKVPPPVLYVTQFGNGNQSGTNWANAFQGLKPALAAASGCQQIWVAKGTYYAGTNANASYSLRSGISIYGGFTGTETNLSQRNFTTNITLFSAEIGNLATNTDNCRNIFDNNGLVLNCDSSAILDGCTLEGAFYAAVFNFDASPTIRNCVFRKNGGTVDSSWTGNLPTLVVNPLIENCLFENNLGPLHAAHANPTIRNCIFRGNTGSPGSCLDFESQCVVSVVNCKFERNFGGRGGVMSTGGSDVSFVNCLMDKNQTSFHGGAVWSAQSVLRFTNCTITENSAAYSGGGIYAQTGGTNYIYNSIFWNNSEGTREGDTYTAQIHADSNIPANILNSCVQGLSAAVNGNSFYDPLFANAAGSNYNLTASSPLIDAGSATLATGISTDLAGSNRVANARVDVGAYEFQSAKGTALSLLSIPEPFFACGANNVAIFSVVGSVGGTNVYQWQVNTGSGFSNVPVGALYSVTTSGNASTLRISSAALSMSGYQYRVTVPAIGYSSTPVSLTVHPAVVLKVHPQGNGTDGATWGTAFTNLQEAINAADTCTEIWVAKGTYRPSGASPYSMKSGVMIFGGFTGAESSRDQRNWTNNVVTLQNVGTRPVFGNYYSQSDMYSLPIDNTAVLDGFTLTTTNASVAAIDNWTVSPTIRNCRFTANVGKAFGNYRSSCVISNCTFTNNFQTVIGNRDSSPTIVSSLFVANSDTGIDNSSSSPLIQDCVFRNNTAFGASAIRNGYGSSPNISRCSFANNSSASQGGGVMINYDRSQSLVNNCLFTGNVSTGNGGAIQHYAGDMTVVNCTFSGNRSTRSGGATYINSGTVTVLNSILWDNIAEEFGRAPALEQAQIKNLTGLLVISNSCVQGLNLYATNNNIGYDPLFVYPSAGDFTLLSSSPCIDAGNNVFQSATNDLNKATRRAAINVDMGAYEFPGLPTNTVRVSTALVAKSICVGDSTTFSMAKAADSTVNLLWQVDSGSGFVNVTNGSLFAVANTSSATTLTFAGSLSPTNYQIRIIGSNTTFTTPAVNLGVRTASIVYVNRAATGLQNGTTWANAFTNLQQATASVGACAQVWVAQGVYNSSGAVDGSGYVRLKSGMAVYGGFVGNETSLSQRNWTNYAPVIIGGIVNVYNPAAGYSQPIDRSAVLDGFFISDTNGTSLYNDQASPTIRNCTFARNTAPAIWNDNTSLPLIENCAFTNNSAIAILNEHGSSPYIANGRFINNRDMSVKTDGISAPVITNCVFTGNVVTNGYPGVIWNSENVTAVITHCQFTGNISTGDGGAIYNRLSSPVLENLLLANNQARRGGAIYHSGGNITLKNCTVAVNSSVGFGGGVFNASGVVRLENSIACNNTATDSAASREAQQLKDSGGTFEVVNSCVEGLSAYSGSNNIAADPIFVNFPAGDFRLQPISPALNAGSNIYATSIAGDLDNNPRVYGASVDMGAYELQSPAQTPIYIFGQPKSMAACEGGGVRLTVRGAAGSGASFQWQINGGSGFTNVVSSDFINAVASSDSSTLSLDSLVSDQSGKPIRYVYGGYTSPPVTVTVSVPTVAYLKASATGTGDGSSWTNAFTNLKDAIAAAGSCSELWVAQGTYAPASILSLKNGLAVYGGFVGTETSRAQRDWTIHPTILSGATSGWLFYNDASYEEIDQRAVLDGFVISGCSAYAAIVNRFASPTIRNCTFTNNVRNAISSSKSSSLVFNCVFTGNGGGLDNSTGSDLRVVSCIFSNNIAPGYNSGVAMANRDSSPVVEKSVFVSNKSETGGAIANSGTSAPTFLRCIFRNNTAREGGAVNDIGAAAPTFRNCLFVGNISQSRGGAIVHYGTPSLTLVNCTVADNRGSDGGGIFLQGYATIRNCILWYNSANSGMLEDQQIKISQGGSPLTISHSSVQGLMALSGNTNSAEEPLFASRAAGNFQLITNSPLIDLGNGSFNPDTFDLAGNPRVANALIDMGAYEFQGAKTGTLHFTELPQSLTKCAGNNVLFKAAGISGGGYNYQWQKFNGTNFVNITSGGIYTISATNNVGSLLIEGVSVGMTGDRYRFVETATGFTAPEAVLTVIPPGVIYVNQNVVTPGSGGNWATAFARLEDAIALGNECSQIWVAAGTYTPTNSAGQSIYLQLETGLKLYGGFSGNETNLSQRNWTNNITRITGSGENGIFYNAGYSTPVDSSARVDGFVISSTDSAAIYNFSASPTIANCIFENNSFGGIYNLYNSNPTLTNCVFRNNTEYSSLENRDSSPLVTDCVFTNNTGVFGTVSEGSSSGRYVGCKFLDNSGQYNGAVTVWASSQTVFERCVFDGNTSSNSGGAISFEANCTGALTNCLFVNNRAQYNGGAIENSGSTLSIVNCTLSQNSALYYGGGFYQSLGAGTIINSILWNNEGSDQFNTLERKQVYADGGTLSVSYSIVQGLSTYSGSGNAAYDPLFVNPASGNFGLLQYFSPAQNVGLNSALNLNNPDLAGNSRLIQAAVDMGPYEVQVASLQPLYFTSLPTSQSTCVDGFATFKVGTSAGGGANVRWEVDTGSGFNEVVADALHIVTSDSTSATLTVTNALLSMNGRQFRFYIVGSGFFSPAYLLNVSPRGTIYVKANATGTQNGANWNNAYTTLQAAVAAGDGCSEVWVASGTYTPNGTQVELKTGMKIYGGFTGTETNLTQRNWTNNISLLQGDPTGGMIYNRGDSGPKIDRTAVLDGFTIIGFDRHSGIENLSASPTIRNCRFVGNPYFSIENSYNSAPFIETCSFVTNFDSAIFNTANAAPFITNCLFIGNQGAWGGGGILNSGGSCTIAKCQFIGNSARYDGGAVLNQDGAVTEIINCVFSNNVVQSAGGAFANSSLAVATLKDCLFYHNSANHIGAVDNNHATLTLIHCTVADNSAQRFAGGIYTDGGTLTVRNSIVWGNTHSSDWGNMEQAQIYLVTGSLATVSHTCIQGLNTFAGNSNIPYDPLFANEATGDLHARDYSPTLNRGSNTYSAGINLDLDGNPRIRGVENVDMGVYEYSGADYPVELISHPVSQSACAGNTVTFTAQGNGLQWAFATPANPNFDYFYYNLGGARFSGPAGGDYYLYTNGNVITLVISNITTTMNGYQFREHYRAPSPAILNVSQPSVMYVNASGPANGDGSSWATAYNSLQTAIAQADQCRRVIWVAAGTYYPGTIVNEKFSIPEGLEIYGGFAGTETNLSQRNLQSNFTILSGDIGTPGNASDNSPVVVSIDRRLTSYLANNTILDGLVVEQTHFGIDVYGVNAQIRNCIIRSNSGTGLRITQASPRVENCSFLANTSISGGGGLGSFSSSPAIVNCSFRGNSGPFGGGIEAQSSTLSISNSLFSGNFSTGFGGAIGIIGGQADIVNSTFSGNATPYSNAGGVEGAGATINLRNSILWNNLAANRAPGETQQFYNTGSNSVRNCCFQGITSYNQSPIGGQNIASDPLFIESLSPGSAPSIAGDFHLQSCSPAYNVGHNFYADGLTTDLDGAPRFIGTIDIGAYEWQTVASAPLVVTTNPVSFAFCSLTTNKFTAGASGTGLSYQWEADFNNGAGFNALSENENFRGVTTSTLGLVGIPPTVNGAQFRCLFTSSAGCSVRSQAATLSVPAQRVFVNASAASNGDGSSWNSAFQTVQSALATCATEIWIASGTYIAPSGGFVLKNNVAIYGGFAGTETSVDQRDWHAHETVIHNNGAIYAFSNTGTLNDSARLDGVVIEGCNYGDNDAGISLQNFADAMIINCLFRNNRVGIQIAGCSPTIRNCNFETNGAVANTVRISLAGGGVYINSGAPLIERCVFRGNSAQQGGGISSYFGSSAPQIVNCVFSGNHSTSSGAAISHLGSGTLVVRNCTIAGNRTDNIGAGIAASGPINVFNSIIWNNADTQNSTAELAQFYASSTVVISNTCLQNMTTSAYLSNGNVNVDPMFVAPTIPSTAPTLAGDYHLTCLSPMLNAGNVSQVAGYALDVDGADRVFFGGVDMGAYELQVATATFSAVTQPQDSQGGTNDQVTFTVTPSDAGASYKWQVSHAGGSFSDVSNGVNYSGATTAQLAVTNLTASMDGDRFRCELQSPVGCLLDSKVVTFTFTVPIAVAVDAPELTWSTGGDVNWIGQIKTSHDGVDAAQSGVIGDSKESWMETTVVGPGSLTFWWKVSSGANDFLEFYVNGVLQTGHIAGEVDWSQSSYTIASGNSTLRWRYVKNASGTAGQDRAWVDQVVFIPNLPTINTQPASQTVAVGDIVTFSVGASGQPPLRYQWRSNTVDILNATNSSYTINGAQFSSAANYSVLVTNQGGGILSASAALTVLAADPPSITAHPTNQFGSQGLPTTFTVGATGFGVLHYQWRLNATDIPGATGSSYTIGSVQPAHAGIYSVFITNRFGTALSSNATLNVFTLGEAVDATNLTWSTGGNAVWLPQTNVTFDGVDAAQSGSISDNQSTWMETTVNGPGILNFRWKVSSEASFDVLRFTVDGAAQSGGAISGEVNWTLKTYSIGAGARTLRWQYAKDDTVSKGANLGWVDTVSFLPAAAITAQPTNLTVVVSNTATFAVTATGAGLGYQWRFNNNAISGATSSAYVIPNAVLANEGNYSVIITNSGGSITSSNAALTVLFAPVITAQPQPQSIVSGYNATFSVGAVGRNPLSYQWRKNGTPIADAVTSSYTLNEVRSIDAGNYSVVVTNIDGSAVSSEALLTVLLQVPNITTQPQSQSVIQGSGATFTVAAGGSIPMSYQWRFNNVDIQGATDSSFNVESGTANNAGTYAVHITNEAGFSDSQNAILTVLIPPSFLVHPQSQTVTQGNTVTLSASVSGTAPLNFQWTRFGTDIPGATASNYVIAAVSTNHTGPYVLHVSNAAGTNASVSATLTVLAPPAITTQPASQNVALNTNVNFTVVATGTMPLSYQWLFNSTNVSGATTSAYTIPNATLTNAGSYAVIITNVAGTVTSSVAVLTVSTLPPSITSQPAGQTVAPGQPVSFAVTVTGSAPLVYQWRKDGTAISGATNSTLSITNAQPTHGGIYSVVIVNGAGSATSVDALLTVSDFANSNSIDLPFIGNGRANPYPAQISVSGLIGNVTKVTATIHDFGHVYPSELSLLLVGPQGQKVVLMANAGLYFNVDHLDMTFDDSAVDQLPVSSQLSSGTFQPADYDGAADLPTPAPARPYANLLSAFDGAVPNGTWSLYIGDNYAEWDGGYISGGFSLHIETDYGKPATITQQPVDHAVPVSSNVTFSVAAISSLPLAYQWQKGGANITSETNTSYTISNVQPSHGGTYAVVVSNANGIVTSSNAVLTVQIPPAITAQPAGLTNAAGTSASFSVTATGDAPLNYQWRKNGINISGAIDSSYVITNAQISHIGDYSVVVTNIAGTVTSSNATLLVLAPPGITVQPQGKTNNLGTNITLSVTATGTAPLVYQWSLGGVNIAGATGSSYSITNIQPVHGGLYTVFVGNAIGTALSSNALVRVDATNYLAGLPQFTLGGSGAKVNCLAVQDDGKLILGGYFTSVNGVPRNMLARLNTDGTLDMTWNPQASGMVFGLAVSGADVYAGGQFFFVGGNYRPFLAKISTNGVGALDASWVPDLDNIVRAVAVNGTDVYAGGAFTTVASQSCNRIAKFSAATGALDLTWNPGADNDVYAIATAGTNVYVGGLFTTFGGQARNRIAKIGSDGVLDPVWNPNSNNDVLSLVLRGQDLFVGGGFSTIGGQTRFNLAKLDAAGTGAAIASWANPQLNSRVWAITLLNNDVYAGGWSTFANGISRSRLAKFNITTGTMDPLWNPNMTGDVYAMATVGQSIYAGGTFSKSGINPRQALARYLMTASAPSIAQQPQDTSAIAGSSATFTVGANGTELLTYLWRKNGSTILTTTNSSLTITNVQVANLGAYSVMVTNTNGFALSVDATLSLATPISLTCSPDILTTVEATVTQSDPIAFEATATGTPTPTITYRVGNTVITSPYAFNGGTNLVAVTASNGSSPDATCSFAVVVNRKPLPANDHLMTRRNQAVTASELTLTTNDTDADGNLFSIVAASSTSTNGAPVVLNAGSITYTPRTGFTGDDRFTYTIGDIYGAKNTATVVVSVNVDAATVSAVKTATNITIQMSGLPGLHYVIQSADNLNGAWTNLSGTLTADGSGAITYSDVTPLPTARFYRTIAVP